MKMKIICTLLFLISAALSVLLPHLALGLPLAIAGAFAAYGVARSVALHLDPLSGLGDAFRVLLACLGGYLLTLDRVFIFPSLGILLCFASLILNNAQLPLPELPYFARFPLPERSVVLLGIDGSGKSSHAEASGEWLRGRGYTVTTMLYHKYLFLEKFTSSIRNASGRSASDDPAKVGRISGGNPLRPLLSLADNLMLQIGSSIGSLAEGSVVVYDRFLWSTYIKYGALSYPVRPLAFFYLLPRPPIAIVLDVPVEKSLKVMDERGPSQIHYPRSVLEMEREEYLAIARKNGYAIVDATATFNEVQEKIELQLSSFFPRIGT